jgi:NAD(P)-dependent dehydrogenase (short-subunit alcohol dehydrogenase family)
MTEDPASQVAVITGAASGLGLAIAERCVYDRRRVVLADIEEDLLRQLPTNWASGARSWQFQRTSPMTRRSTTSAARRKNSAQ